MAGPQGRIPVYAGAEDENIRPLLRKGKVEDNEEEEEEQQQQRGRSSLSESRNGPPYYGGGGGGRSAAPSQASTFAGRRSMMRSRSPREVVAEDKAKRKYMFAAFFLGVSLVSFCVQTELSSYIQNDLGWGKAYCMMYLTHGSWVVLWPVQLLVLRSQKRDVPWGVFLRQHFESLRTTAVMVETRSLRAYRHPSSSVRLNADPVRYLAKFTAIVTTALTVAGLSWYVAVALTTPSDLTAIYNCSAFFAYVFSVPLLHEPLRLDKSVAVVIAIAGVLVVAYGGSSSGDGDDVTASGRFVGNLVIGVGSVLYGLYEVLYKRYACPPEGVSPGRGVIFANTFGSLIGLFTLTVLWFPLPLLHWTGIELFELPTGKTAWLVLAAVLSNATFSGSFLVLISLTSPVLSSVAALLTIFIVALADWLITAKPLSFAAIVGGSMITLAFLALSFSTYREMKEHEAQKLAVDLSDSDVEADGSDDNHD
ncbi:EamA-like transporter family [Geosmithia morbida]|uniref:EamA-like transporter family n=1 Tax=Geosmithia morbida TaxID=1094350 RepID=A0A9P5D588_9HYPO|nr:EamA-like transporter family [Geosmithia morbida]KAF4124306.1 EamA-like transporter family [Geosmithia morbida]